MEREGTPIIMDQNVEIIFNDGLSSTQLESPAEFVRYIRNGSFIIQTEDRIPPPIIGLHDHLFPDISKKPFNQYSDDELMVFTNSDKDKLVTQFWYSIPILHSHCYRLLKEYINLHINRPELNPDVLLTYFQEYLFFMKRNLPEQYIQNSKEFWHNLINNTLNSKSVLTRTSGGLVPFGNRLNKKGVENLQCKIDEVFRQE